jgi:hypothetical protein
MCMYMCCWKLPVSKVSLVRVIKFIVGLSLNHRRLVRVIEALQYFDQVFSHDSQGNSRKEIKMGNWSVFISCNSWSSWYYLFCVIIISQDNVTTNKDIRHCIYEGEICVQCYLKVTGCLDTADCTSDNIT